MAIVQEQNETIVTNGNNANGNANEHFSNQHVDFSIPGTANITDGWADMSAPVGRIFANGDVTITLLPSVQNASIIANGQTYINAMDTVAGISGWLNNGGTLLGNAHEDSLYLQVSRLYQGVLSRTPDKAGLEYWADDMVTYDRTLTDAATGFVSSYELTGGNLLSHTAFTSVLYNNVLGREQDGAGFNYWTAQLERRTEELSGDAVRAQAEVLTGFTESDEFKEISKQKIEEALGNMYAGSNTGIAFTIESNPETYVTGTFGADTIYANGRGGTYLLGAGNDTITVTGDDIYADGGTGHDTGWFANGNTILNFNEFTAGDNNYIKFTDGARAFIGASNTVVVSAEGTLQKTDITLGRDNEIYLENLDANQKFTVYTYDDSTLR